MFNCLKGSTKFVLKLFAGLTVITLSLFSNSTHGLSQHKIDDIDISGVWYLSHVSGESGGADVNEFYAHRGYLNFKPKFNSDLSARITPDIHIDDTGDVKVRLKYLYMNFNLPGNEFFTKPYFEFGLVHRTWLDYEEHINYYRMQGKMYLETNGLHNSADFGLTFVSLLGGELDNDYKMNVNSKYPGRYGSIAFGIYNGGGYHAVEKNTNKEVEARVSIRPVPDTVPGLQLSYYGVYGKGNTVEEPDWVMNTLFTSYEHQNLVLTGTLYTGKGNSKGNALDLKGNASEMSGYSAFSEIKFPNSKFALIGRYDSFDPDTNIDDNNVNRYIVGLAYKFQGKHKVLLDYDYAKNELTDKKKNALFKFTVEVHF